MMRMRFYARQELLVILATVALTVGLAAQAPNKEFGATKKERAEAERLWEQMVDAKGGRKKLYAITNMMVTKGGQKTDFTQVQFYVYPDRFWEWSKGRIAGRDYLDVTMANLERGVFTVVGLSGLLMDKKNLNRAGGATFGEGYLMDSCDFLLETKWLQPTPLRISRQILGKNKYDVIETRFDQLSEYRNIRRDFYVEPETLEVVGVRDFDLQGRGGRLTLFDGYTVVDGIRVPNKLSVILSMDQFGKRAYVQLSFRFNVDYDPALFDTIPSAQVGSDAWRRK